MEIFSLRRKIHNAVLFLFLMGFVYFNTNVAFNSKPSRIFRQQYLSFRIIKVSRMMCLFSHGINMSEVSRTVCVYTRRKWLAQLASPMVIALVKILISLVFYSTVIFTSTCFFSSFVFCSWQFSNVYRTRWWKKERAKKWKKLCTLLWNTVQFVSSVKKVSTSNFTE